MLLCALKAPRTRLLQKTKGSSWDKTAVHQTVFPSYHVSVIGVTNAFCVWTIYERMRLQVRGAYDERMRDSAVHSQMQALAAKELDEKSLFLGIRTDPMRPIHRD